MFRFVRSRSFVGMAVLFGVLLFLANTAQAQLFQGDGKDYVVYVSGKLRIFSKFANTRVTVRNLSNNAVVWTLTLAQKDMAAERAFTGAHLRVTATKSVNIATGNLLTHNSSQNNNLSYATYLISENGSRLGRSFIGFVSTDLVVFCHKSTATGISPRVTVEDLSETSGPDNDDKTLTTFNSTIDKPEVTIWQRGGFDDDLIRVTTSQDCAVMAGHNVHAKAIGDWSVMPPSMQPGEAGLAYGTRFYLFVHRTMAITALSNNTRISIRDFSDGDDNAKLTLNRNQVYTPIAFGQTYSSYTQKVASVGGFDDDYIEVTANKPVWVYVGPTSANKNSHSVSPVSIPIGNGQQEAYCFIQKGSSNNLQIFVADKTAEVSVTTIAGDNGISTTSRRVGGSSGATWKGAANGPYWWESNSFSNELVFIRSSKPMSVFCGGLGGFSWQSFISHERLNSEPVVGTPGNKVKFSACTGKALTINVSASDPNGDTLTWKQSWSTSNGNSPPGVTVSGGGNSRSLSWAPSASQSGSYFWTIEVTDNGVPSLTTKLVIEIVVGASSCGGNRPPVFVTSIPPTVAVQLNSTFSYIPRAVDPDGDPVTYTMINSAPGATYTNGRVSWTASSTQFKVGDSFTFTMRACDNKKPPACTNQTWVVLVTRSNRPPRFTSTPPTSIREGQLFDYIPQVTDPDPGDVGALRFTAVSVTDVSTGRTPAGVVTNLNNGRITWTPNSTQGGKSYWVEIVVCDPQGACAGQQWTLQVIDVITNPPKITSTPPTKGSVNVTYIYAPTFTDADLPNDSHTWTLRSRPSSATFNTSTGRISWTPTSGDANQSFAFELVICDRAQQCDTQRWSVTIGTGNRPPRITSTPPRFSPFVGRIYLYNATAVDPDPNEILTWTMLRGPVGASINSATGVFQWTPTARDRGRRVTFSVRVCDRANLCDTQTWTTGPVLGPNQPPVFTSTPSTTVVENQTYRYPATASDPDPGDTVTIKLKQGPSGATISRTGVVSWKTTPADGGKTVTFVLEACDQFNNCTQQRWKLFVINTNTKPVIATAPITRATVGVLYTYTLKAVDPDANDVLVWTNEIPRAYPVVTFVQNSQNQYEATFSFMPAPADDGKTFKFSVAVKDKAGERDDQTWEVKVGKTVNKGPTITSKPPTTATEDSPYNYTATATDPDDNVNTLVWKLDQGPAGATINPKTGKITWTPGDADVTNTPVSFKITVCDPSGACASQSWQVAVNNVNDPPVITSRITSALGKVGSVYTYPAVAFDPDPGHQLKLVWSLPAGQKGSAKIDPSTGVFTWTPAPGDASKNSTFTIRVCDPLKACDNQTFVIGVGKGNSPPNIVSTAPSIAFVGEDIAYQAVAVDPDVGDTLSWQMSGGPKPASIDQRKGLLSWTPTPNDYGKTFPFSIEVCDDANPPACDKQVFNVKVARKCRMDLQCPGKDICVELPNSRYRVCIPPGCSLLTATCNPKFFCKDGGCVRDKCPDPNCSSKICRPVTGCIRSCAGVKCSVGSRCIDGSCIPTPCVANACKSSEVCDSSDKLAPTCIANPCQAPGQCKHGRVCSYDRCIDDPCKFMKCPTGQICSAGQCLFPRDCEVDIDCAGNEVCENNKCVEPGCYTKFPRCPSKGDLCLKTNCKEDPCSPGGVLQCTSDQFCRATDGKCGNVCDKAAKAKCGTNEKCVDGSCERDPCAGRNCPAGRVCVGGVCITDRCTASNVCKHGRICNPEISRCVDDPCLYMKCPSGVCRFGQCVDNPCRVDKDCINNQICVNGECREPNCPTKPCAPGELCVNGRCSSNPCNNKQCPPGQYCKNGDCIDPCKDCPSGTVCVNGKCVNNPCSNVKCPANQVCSNGACVPECCTGDSCKFKRVCRACQCFDNPCDGVTCPSGSVCDPITGACRPPSGSCDVDVNHCPDQQVCIDGKCSPPGCYTAKDCKESQICLKGKCEDNPCKGKQCKDNEVCRPIDGQCVPNCDCKEGQVCTNGVCSDDPCAKKSCPTGKTCRNGNCEDELPCDKTDNASDKICKHKRVCKNNVTNASQPKANCGDDPCAGITCKSGFGCKSGQCWPCSDSNPAEVCKTPGEGKENGDGDAGPEGDYRTVATGGCGCSSDSNPAPFTFLFLLLGAVLVLRRRSSFE